MKQQTLPLAPYRLQSSMQRLVEAAIQFNVTGTCSFDYVVVTDCVVATLSHIKPGALNPRTVNVNVPAAVTPLEATETVELVVVMVKV